MSKNIDQELVRDETTNVHSEVQNQTETNDEIDKDTEMKHKDEAASQNNVEENTPKQVQSKIRTYYASSDFEPNDLVNEEHKEKLQRAILVIWVDYKNKCKFKKLMKVQSKEAWTNAC
jgi:hypothetical protein